MQCGELEQKLGEARQDLIAAATKDFLQPLHTFLDGDMKTVQVRRCVPPTREIVQFW